MNTVFPSIVFFGKVHSSLRTEVTAQISYTSLAFGPQPAQIEAVPAPKDLHDLGPLFIGSSIDPEPKGFVPRNVVVTNGNCDYPTGFLVKTGPRVLDEHCIVTLQTLELGLEPFPEFQSVRKLDICLDGIVGQSEPQRIRGISSYRNLEQLGFQHCKLPPKDQRPKLSLEGLEKCSKLLDLDISYMGVDDLSFLKDLSLQRLDITGNPVTTLDHVNLGSLEWLGIDSSMLHLLEGRDIPSLKTFCAICDGPNQSDTANEDHDGSD